MVSISDAYEFVDLSHTIEAGLITYKGLPGPIICDFLSREDAARKYLEGETFQFDKIEMVGNSGTYLDSPFHRYAEGKDLSELPLEKIAGLDCVVVRSEAKNLNHAVRPTDLKGLDVRGKAVLFHTGWDKHWNTDAYMQGNSYLATETAQYLMDRGAALAGIDSLNIDGTENMARPVHTLLLGNEIPIVEHLRGLDSVPDTGATFFAVPPKMKAIGTFPVRAFVLFKK